MALRHGTVNPLSALGVRKLTFLPEHFVKITVRKTPLDTKKLDLWINYNLNSRYAIRKTFILDESKKVVEATEIGFEDPKEITMFSLGCPLIH
jgi:hypothetical protein